MPDAAVPLSASRLVLQAKRLEIEAVRRLAARCALVEAVGRLIQALQRERGAASIWLASQGQRFGDVRRQTVAATGPAEAEVRRLFADQLLPVGPTERPDARLVALAAWVLLGLEALVELRGSIERRCSSAHDAVAAYSRLIAGPVELIVHVADAAPLPGVSRLLVALLHLVQGNEAAGQERAIGALLFASGRCSEAHRQRVLHLIEAQESSLRVFADFAGERLQSRLETVQVAAETARLERLRRTLAGARPEAALDTDLSDAWFEVCSERIAALWALEGELLQELRHACEAEVRRAEQDLHDAEGLLQRLREAPPAQAHAVERFFDVTTLPEALPALASARSGGPAGSASLVDLLQAQSARLAGMEAELEDARRALRERKVIERAKGVLMSRLGMTEEAAFRALQKTSMDQNRRLLEVAEATLVLPDAAFARLAAAPPASG